MFSIVLGLMRLAHSVLSGPHTLSNAPAFTSHTYCYLIFPYLAVPCDSIYRFLGALVVPIYIIVIC